MSDHTFIALWVNLALFLVCHCQDSQLEFIQNMDGNEIQENREVGTSAYDLLGRSTNDGQITYGIISDFFEVRDATIGEVFISRALDFETTPEIPARVWMRQNTDYLEENVVIRLVNIDDEAPYFMDTPYTARIPEDTQRNSVILSLTARDDDNIISDAARIDVSCQSPINDNEVNPCAYFALRPSSTPTGALWEGDIILRRSLDFETIPSFAMTIYARDQSGVADQFSTETVSIQVVDVQDTPPVFTSASNAQVEENSQADTLVIRVEAQDGDTQNARSVRYELVTNPDDNFRLDTETGELFLTKPLSSMMVTPQIRACEVFNATHVYPDACEIQELQVAVVDINNNSPVFTPANYVAEVTENIEDDSPIVTITVTDADQGLNARFAVRLLNHADIFGVSITSGTGSMTPSVYVRDSTQIDYETGPQTYTLQIEAKETDTPEQRSSRGFVDVQILDENDNAPMFDDTSYFASVIETATSGTPVITITARDADLSANFGPPSVRYKVVGNGADRFRVNARTGEITVRDCPTPGSGNCLDAERKRTYMLTYYAADSFGEGFVTTVPLVINITNANDNRPRFDSDEYVGFISEGETETYEPIPMQVQAIDADLPDVMTYRILSGNPDVWQINPRTGIITAIEPIDYEAIPGGLNYYEMTVEASDGDNVDTTTVTINVDDVNEHAPVFIPDAFYEETIFEDTPPGTTVETLRATDGDSPNQPNGRVVYRIISGSRDQFTMDPDEGIVTVSPNAAFDYDVRNLYNMTILAHDQGQPTRSATATLWVHIRDSNNKSPIFVPATVRQTIPETTPIGRSVVRMTATDPDQTASLAYFLEAPRSAVDPQDNPVDPANVPNFDYLFSIEQDTGIVRVNSTLDYAKVARYQTTVRAVDNAGGADQTATARLIITITPVNTRPPYFILPWTPENPFISTSAREGQPPGTYVTTLVANDDTDAISEYRIINDPSDYFDIDRTGRVTTTRPLDYETNDRLSFVAIAVDTGDPQLTSTATVQVEVQNVNDFTPEFIETDEEDVYNVMLRENAPGGTPVVSITAVDNDRSGPGDLDYGTVRYSMNDPLNRFVINEATGQITVQDDAVLDREEEPVITLTATAYDSPNNPDDRLFRLVSIYVTLEDSNDHPPIFTQALYNAVIFENVPALTSVIELGANDEDAPGPNSQLSYYEISGDELEMFEIQPETGVITTRNSTIRGLAGEYTLTVGVTDRGDPAPLTGSTQVLISVLATNNQAPRWIVPAVNNQTATILEGPQDPSIIDVDAVDDDPGPNGEITYGFYDGTLFVSETEDFTINPTSGQISAKREFDREEKSSYTLLLVARDNGDPFYESTRYLIVRVGDIDDNNPEFPGYYNCCSIPQTVSIYEDTIYEPEPTLIGTVKAIDADTGQAAQIEYTIVDGNEDGVFSLHSTKGELKLIRPLAYEVQNFYNLTIRASDGSDLVYTFDDLPEQCLCDSLSTMQLYINVLDVNQYAPQWAGIHHACLSVDAQIGHLVTVLEAIDRDTGTSDMVNYEIEGNITYKRDAQSNNIREALNSFVIGQTNGTVYSNTLMERFENHFFNISVLAIDMTNDSRSQDDTMFTSSTDLLVWVTDPTDEITMVFDDPPEEVRNRTEEILAIIQRRTNGAIVCISDVRYHVSDNNVVVRDRTDLTFHVIDGGTYTVIDPGVVVDRLEGDKELEALGMIDVHESFSIWGGFIIDPVLAAIIVILFLLLLLLLLLFCCCCIWGFCVKEGYAPLYIGTINPLWGVKSSEDQELTMAIKDYETVEKSAVTAAGGGYNQGSFFNKAYEEDIVDSNNVELMTKTERSWHYESHQESNGNVMSAGGGGRSGRGGFSSYEETTRIEAPLESASVTSFGASLPGGMANGAAGARHRSAATMTDDEMSDVGSAIRERSVTNFGATLTRSGRDVERIIGDTEGSSRQGSDIVDLTKYHTTSAVSMSPSGGNHGSQSMTHIERSYHTSALPTATTRSYHIESNEYIHDMSMPPEHFSDGGFIAPLDDPQYQGEIRLASSLPASPRVVRKSYVEYYD